jgi:ABC-type branched-subunit amino acid transport system ATPase component
LAELVAEQITVRFGGIQALNEVDVVVRAGTVHGLIGPNGAGKTTLFNVITGLQPPTRGRVRFDGDDITRSSPHRRARRGMARTFQRLELFDTLTARENVQMAAETQRRRLPAGSSPAAVTERLLAQVGLTDIADAPTDSLPTGLARLVELARAMATTPSVLLLDEPSAGLNQEETSALGKILLALASDGMAVLLVEHDMSLVMSICDEVTVLHYGEIITSGDPASVQADPAVQAAYLGTEDIQPQPAGGTVRLNGEEIGKASSEQLARRGVCSIPEGRAVFPNLTVAENLLMYTFRGRDVKMAELEEKSYARFPVLGQRRRQLAGRLSGGEQQMLAIARALYTDPRLLLLDEISMGLAPLVVAELYELVGQLVATEDITVVLVEQFAQTALTVADQVAVMVTGRIVRAGTPAEVGDDLMSAYMGTPEG